MITEDYVSFETAKLLKEKGFDVWGDGSFGTVTKIWKEYSPSGILNDCSMSSPNRKAFPAPTLQMAMKWLREVHNITISITFEEDNRIYYELKKNGERKVGVATPLSYEDVCTEAINLCLKTLI